MTLTNPTLIEAIDDPAAVRAGIVFKNDDGTYKSGVVIAAMFNGEIGGLPTFTCEAGYVARDLLATKIILPSEVVAITSERVYDALKTLLQFQTFNFGDPTVVSEITTLLTMGGCTQSIANVLDTAKPQPCTYAEWVWARGTRVQWHDVQVLLREGEAE